VSLTDEGIEVLRHCFTGEKFSFHGKRYDFDDVVIRPRYVQPGGPPLWIAAMSEAGAQRAARNDSNFLPQGARSMVLDPWRATLKASGRNPDNLSRRHHPLLPRDRRRRTRLAGRARRRALSRPVYRSFNKDESAAGGVSGNTREASIPQTWVVGNVEHCVKELTSFVREYGITDLVTWAVPRACGRTDERQSRTLRARRGAARQSRSRGGLGERKDGAWVSGSDWAVRSFRFPARRRTGAGSTCVRPEAWIRSGRPTGSSAVSRSLNR
jgi:Coenzyme F420-dependent N5,N10-methylene tetrahydromethanopterin reductase and related flavin-dependent oxidoreductases